MLFNVHAPPLLLFSSSKDLFVQSIAHPQIRHSPVVDALDQGNASLKFHVRPDIEGEAAVLGLDVLSLHLGVTQLGAFRKIRRAALDENGLARPSAVSVGPPVKKTHGTALLKERRSFRREPERGRVRTPGRPRKGHKTAQSHDPPQFPRHPQPPALDPAFPRGEKRNTRSPSPLTETILADPERSRNGLSAERSAAKSAAPPKRGEPRFLCHT